MWLDRAVEVVRRMVAGELSYSEGMTLVHLYMAQRRRAPRNVWIDDSGDEPSCTSGGGIEA